MTSPASSAPSASAPVTPLVGEHEALGATLITFAGWQMPVRYRSDLAEHHAVRERAGLFDLSHMAEIELRGPGAGAALDHALVGHLSAVAVGRAKYSLLCAPDGGILDDLVVYRLAEDRYLVVANAANAEVVLAALRERSAGFDVEVTDQGAATALIALQGPAAAGVLRTVSDADLDSLRYYAAMDAEVAGTPVLLARTGYTGEDGFELFVDADLAPALWRALLAAGEDAGVEPCGLACRDTLRLEAGMPLYGHELSADRTPYEAGLGRVVALSKDADFVGRSALEARAAEGPRELLVALVAEGRRAPRGGYPVQDPAGTVIGEVTSGALSPTLGTCIAMAYVPVSAAETGTDLVVDVRGTPVPARVVDKPFYRRPS